MRRATLFPIIAALLFLGGCVLQDQAQKFREQLASLNLILQETAAAAGVLQDLPQAVWVRLYSVQAVDAGGNAVSLFDASPEGEAVNLVSVSDVAALLDSRSVPAGQYTALRLKAGTTVTVVRKDGSSNDYQVPNSTPPDFTLEIPFKNPVDLASGDVRSLILNVDLSRLAAAIDDAAGTIDLGQIVADTNTDPGTLPGVQARLQGRVGSVDANGSGFTLLRDDAPSVTVTLHATLGVIIDSNGTPLALADLRPGDRVEAYGGFDPVQLHLLAVAVSVNPQPVARSDEEAGSRRVKVEGTLENVDASAGTADLRVREASLIIGQAVIPVIDLSNAVYPHGGAGLLADGQYVEIKGFWDGSQLDADLVDIEGARPNAESSERPVEVKGQVEAWDDQTRVLTLTLTEVEGPADLTVGQTLTLDLSGAWFKRGAPDCLATGRTVELKGVMGQGTGLAATVVKVEGGCAAFPVRHDADRNGAADGDHHDAENGPDHDQDTESATEEDRDQG